MKWGYLLIVRFITWLQARTARTTHSCGLVLLQWGKIAWKIMTKYHYLKVLLRNYGEGYRYSWGIGRFKGYSNLMFLRNSKIILGTYVLGCLNPTSQNRLDVLISFAHFFLRWYFRKQWPVSRPLRVFQSDFLTPKSFLLLFWKLMINFFSSFVFFFVSTYDILFLWIPRSPLYYSK